MKFTLMMVLALAMVSQASAGEFLGGTLVSRSQKTEIGLECTYTHPERGCTELTVYQRGDSNANFDVLQKIELQQLDKKAFSKKARKAARRDLGENYLGFLGAGTAVGFLICAPIIGKPALCPITIPLGFAFDVAKAPIVVVAAAGHFTGDAIGARRFGKFFEHLTNPANKGVRKTVSNRSLNAVLAALGAKHD